MFMLALFACLQWIAESILFLPFFPPEIISFWGISIAITHSETQKNPCGEEVFNWVISSDLLLLNDPDIPIFLHCSFGSQLFPDVAFAPSSFALFWFWKALQDLGSDHLPILLTIPLCPVFCPNKRFPSFSFQKARWDDFPFTLTLTVLQRNTRLFLFPLLLLCLFLGH